jgi:hypothetical protein
MTILRHSDLRLLAQWERAHQAALLAEMAVGDPPKGVPAAQVAVWAREMRGTADTLFGELLRRQAFGRLEPMPSQRRRPVEDQPSFLASTSPAPL